MSYGIHSRVLTSFTSVLDQKPFCLESAIVIHHDPYSGKRDVKDLNIKKSFD